MIKIDLKLDKMITHRASESVYCMQQATGQLKLLSTVNGKMNVRCWAESNKW